MTDDPVTSAAITAAANAIGISVGRGDPTRVMAIRALEAAVPHIALAAGAAAGDALLERDARIAELEQLAGEVLGSYYQTSDGYRGRVGQVQIARWQATLNGQPTDTT
jgi:hypothetical protein